ncbi:hypothetical protein NECAME_16996 [Necator americanus]|uniref:Uncharacterized protein n=1 Tax=Necator americanus TaxID=51031 RepID=W2TRZ6_NECAM|nr:hypothetical protein NECAME_16996 [Necator americanus]ETN84820.1 hypothetical protein NECAME_16996 [Necator americanus]
MESGGFVVYWWFVYWFEEKRNVLHGSEGGFCYPQRDRGSERRRTGCECFKELPPLVKRRKRSYNYIIATKRLS